MNSLEWIGNLHIGWVESDQVFLKHSIQFAVYCLRNPIAIQELCSTTNTMLHKYKTSLLHKAVNLLQCAVRFMNSFMFCNSVSNVIYIEIKQNFIYIVYIFVTSLNNIYVYIILYDNWIRILDMKNYLLEIYVFI